MKAIIGWSPRFEYGVQIGTTAPANERFSSPVATYSYLFNAAYALSPTTSLGMTLADYANASVAVSPVPSGIAQSSSFAGTPSGITHYGSFVPSLVLSTTLPNAYTPFVELSSFSNASGPHTLDRLQYLTGVTHPVGAHVQFDFEYGFSPGPTPSRYVGFGFASYL